MGESKKSIFVTGCPSIDIAAEMLEDQDSLRNFDIYKKYTGSGNNLDLTPGYIIAMQHPVTTEADYSRYQVEETLNALHDLDLPVLWFWPNVDAGSDWTSKSNSYVS